MSDKAEQAVIKAAMSTAKDVAEGRLSPGELARVAADECRELFGTVAGPDDPLWSLHVDIARQVLALGGMSTAELAEWQAVARSRESKSAERPDVTAEALSSASEAHSPENTGADQVPVPHDPPEVIP